MGPQTQIRDATADDMAAIAAIYRHYVLNTVITFESDPPPPEEMAERWRAITSKGLPYLVATIDGQVAGYAYAAPFRTRHAYRFSVEDTVYLDKTRTGKGLGKMLLSRLVDICTDRGYRQMVGIVAGDDNLASINLHKSLGFEFKGTTEAVGYKFEQWVDTHYLQRPLGPGASEPPKE